jgi:thymidylate synthase
MKTLEIRGLEFQIKNPRDTFMSGIGANFGPRVAACEALQLIGGFSDPEFAVKMVPGLAAFRNEQGGFDGAYGLSADGQLEMAVQRLREDPDTRQAVISIWTPGHAMLQQSRDFPCTLALQFFIRNGMLELDVMMRSNDVDKGLKHDVPQFTQLQLSVAGLLGIPPGTYRHRSGSMHIYESSFDWAKRIMTTHHEQVLHDQVYTPQGISGGEANTVEAMRWRARAISLDEPIPFETEHEAWYRSQVKESMSGSS